MFALLALLRSTLTPSRRPARLSRTLRGPNGKPIGILEHVEVTGAGIVARGRITDGDFSNAVALFDLNAAPTRDRALADAGLLVGAGSDRGPEAVVPLADENRRAAIATELATAVPRPDRERVRALADYAAIIREGHDEQEFAWEAFRAAGGSTMSPWRAFEAGLRAAADRLAS